MIINSIDKLIQYQRDHNFTYWWLYGPHGKTEDPTSKIREYIEQEGNIEDSITRLKNTLSAFDNVGEYHVTMADYTDLKNKRDGRSSFRLSLKNTTQPTLQRKSDSPNSIGSLKDIDKMVEDRVSGVLEQRLKEMEQEQKIKALEAQLADKDKNQVYNRLMDAIEKYAPLALRAMKQGTAKPSITGTPEAHNQSNQEVMQESESIEGSEEAQESFGQAINTIAQKMQEKGMDVTETFVGLASKISEDPDLLDDLDVLL